MPSLHTCLQIPKVPKSTYSKPAEKERLAQAFEFNRKKAEVNGCTQTQRVQVT